MNEPEQEIKSVVQIYLDDPTKIKKIGFLKGTPKTILGIGISLNRDWNELINDWSKPQSQHINEAIVDITIDRNEWDKMRGDRGNFTEFNCAHCASGLGLAGCPGCGHTFEDDHMRCGWNTPLPQKIVEFLAKKGHLFPKDPKLAWEKEEKYWKEIRQKQEEFRKKREASATT